jgi:hypothetical protein
MARGEERHGSTIHYGRRRTIALGACVLLAQASLAYADSSAPIGSDAGAADPLLGSDSLSIVRPRYDLALAEIEGNNMVVNSFDRFLIPALFDLPGDWAQTNLQTAWANVEGPWGITDEAPFPVTEIGHPIQGSLYFIAGRANGFDFWESAAGTAFGALMWKVFGEVDDPYVNSLITTTMGGIALGEMLHRLYIEAASQGSAARFVASPLDAADDALFGKDRDEGARGRVALSLEAGMVAPYLELDPLRGIAPGPGDIAGVVGDTIVYGDPFGDRGAPFDYFEQRFDLALSPSFYGLSFFSDGTLFSLPLVDDQRTELSFASCLHYDYVYSSIVELEANAVGLSLIGERKEADRLALKGELHVNAVVLGANENEYFREFDGAQGINQQGRDYDFCFGEEAKVYLSASQPRLGTLSLELTCYGFQAIPGVYVSSDPPAPVDYSIVGILDLAYERDVAAHLGIGVAYLLYFKDALYGSLPPILESVQAVTVYARLHS